MIRNYSDRKLNNTRRGASLRCRTGRSGTGRVSCAIAAAVIVLMIFCLAEPAFAADGYDKVAEQTTMKPVLQYGMTPIRGVDVNDGSYQIEVKSSSEFFRVEKAVLKVKNGKMTADLTLSSTSYEFVYPGKAVEAAKAPMEDYIKLKERDGHGTFSITVCGLNEEIPCAAFSKKKKTWYDRNILFDAGSLPAGALDFDVPDYDKIGKALRAYENDQSGSGQDVTGDTAEGSGASGGLSSYDPVPVDLEDGEYSIQVNMSGGSGRAAVTSPTWLIVKDGKAWAKLLWSSSYYDYMIVGGEKYLNETTDGGNSTFTIPIAVMDEDMPVIADTTAMGDPVEIEYTLTFYKDSIGSKRQIPQEAAMDVLAVALVIIAAGGILNFIIKKRRKQ